jgi:la-related protein 1
MFLRRQMDSQGFVLLSTIADFNRLKSITQGDYDLLKRVASQCTHVEYRLGVDGKERIRKRFDWEQFVLPDKSLRSESARHDGVEAAPSAQAATQPPMQPTMQPPMQSPWMQSGYYAMASNPMSPREPSSAFSSMNGYPEFPRMSSSEMADYSRMPPNGVVSVPTASGAQNAQPIPQMNGEPLANGTSAQE